MNERYTPEDYETLRIAQFRFDEQMRNVNNERGHLYTTDHNREILEDIEQEIIEERRKVFEALGLEEPDLEPEILY